MDWFRVFHLVGLIIWIGGLLDLTRLLGYHVKEDLSVQERLSRMEFRMFWFVATPGLFITLIMGVSLFISNGGVEHYYQGESHWFHAKTAFLIFLIAEHFIFGRFLMDLRANPRQEKGIRFKVLHGLTGLVVIATLILVKVQPF